MNKKIIGILSAVTLLGGAVYLSGQGGFGALSSSVLGGNACTQANLDAQKSQYEASSTQIASLEEQMSSVEDSISSAQESIATYQSRVAEKKQEIKNTNQEVNQLENYIKNQCGVKKQSGGRGGAVISSAADCEPKKNQIASKKQQIKNLEKSVNETNNTLQITQKNIQNNKEKLKQLESELARLESLAEEITKCEEILASGTSEAAETGTNDEVTENLESELGGELIEDNIASEIEGDKSTAITTTPTPPATTATPISSPPRTGEDNSSVVAINEIDGKIDTFEKLKVASKVLSDYISSFTSYDSRGAISVFTEDELNKIATRYDVLIATGKALEQELSQIKSTANYTATPFPDNKNNALLRSKTKELDKVSKKRDNLMKKIESLNSKWYIIAIAAPSDAGEKAKKDIDDKIKDLKKEITLLESKTVKLRREYYEIHRSNAIKQSSETEKARVTILQQIIQANFEYKQAQTHLERISPLIESFKTGKDNSKMCTIHVGWRALDSSLVNISSEIINKFAPGKINLENFTTEKPLKNSLAARAEEAYSEIKNVLPRLENEISRYESQDNKRAQLAHASCLQWWKIENEKRISLESSNKTLSTLKPGVVELRRFMTWMDENHFTGNN